ncbi:MAG: hypothetical protein ACO25B_03505 [Chitinophagaceae bacterium]
MKQLLLLIGLSTLVFSASDCKEKKTEASFKGRLEVAGICMNYTISVLEGSPGADAVEDSWTDEVSGKEYKNVFRLGNPCDFPSDIKAGDEFKFVIDTAKGKICAVCMAYYPTPSRALSIKVLK